MFRKVKGIFLTPEEPFQQINIPAPEHLQAIALQQDKSVCLSLENEPNDRLISLSLKTLDEPFVLNL